MSVALSPLVKLQCNNPALNQTSNSTKGFHKNRVYMELTAQRAIPENCEITIRYTSVFEVILLNSFELRYMGIINHFAWVWYNYRVVLFRVLYHVKRVSWKNGFFNATATDVVTKPSSEHSLLLSNVSTVQREFSNGKKNYDSKFKDQTNLTYC